MSRQFVLSQRSGRCIAVGCAAHLTFEVATVPFRSSGTNFTSHVRHETMHFERRASNFAHLRRRVFCFGGIVHGSFEEKKLPSRSGPVQRKANLIRV